MRAVPLASSAGKFLAQAIIQRGVGDTQLGQSQLRLVRRAAVIQAVGRGEGAHGGDVAVAGQLIDAERGADPIAAGVAAALVVGVDAAVEAGAGREVDHQVGSAGGGAGRQGRTHRYARQVGQQQQAALERRGGDGLAVEAGEGVRRECVGNPALVAQRDLAVLADQQRDVHDAVLDVLRRQVGVGEEVAALVEVAGDFLGHGAQVGQGQFGAGLEAGHADQLGFGKQRRRHAQLVDDDARAVTDGRGCGWSVGDANLRRRRLQRRGRRNELELAACAGLAGCEGCLAEREQRQRQQFEAELRILDWVWHADSLQKVHVGECSPNVSSQEYSTVVQYLFSIKCCGEIFLTIVHT